MKRILSFALPLALLATTGCAQLVSKTYKPYRGGTVRYSTGWFMAEKNRAKAVEEMKSYCSPSRPVLMAEDTREEFTGYSHSTSRASKNNVYTDTSQSKENNIYMHFKCSSRQVSRME